MLNKALHLSGQVFERDIERRATRTGFGTGLLVAGEQNPNVVALSADLKESTQTEVFASKFPERFFECGVAEQNMVTIAAGLGVSGKIPYVASYAAFCPGRTWEQIRTTICYNNANVKIAGHHAGISVGADGVTHQATEDIATMRVMSNMKIFIPCDALQAHKMTIAASKIMGPIYLRFARAKTPVFTTEETPFVPAKLQVLWQGKKPKVAIIACGSMVYTALEAARELARNKIDTVVANCHTVKPLDKAKVVELAKIAGAVVTAEEHQVAGGMGSAVAEALSQTLPTPVEFVGIRDVYAESGTPDELIAKYGMSVKDIVHAAKKAIRRKG